MVMVSALPPPLISYFTLPQLLLVRSDELANPNPANNEAKLEGPCGVGPFLAGVLNKV